MVTNQCKDESIKKIIESKLSVFKVILLIKYLFQQFLRLIVCSLINHPECETHKP